MLGPELTAGLCLWCWGHAVAQPGGNWSQMCPRGAPEPPPRPGDLHPQRGWRCSPCPTSPAWLLPLPLLLLPGARLSRGSWGGSSASLPHRSMGPRDGRRGAGGSSAAGDFRSLCQHEGWGRRKEPVGGGFTKPQGQRYVPRPLFISRRAWQLPFTWKICCFPLLSFFFLALLRFFLAPSEPLAGC